MRALLLILLAEYNDDIAQQSPSFLIQPTCLSVSSTKLSTFIIQIVKHAGNGKGNSLPPPLPLQHQLKLTNLTLGE
jgi:hypothetical protein